MNTEPVSGGTRSYAKPDRDMLLGLSRKRTELAADRTVTHLLLIGMPLVQLAMLSIAVMVAVHM